MQDVLTATQTRGARLALAAVAVALFGLLSMHGWGSHAGAHPVGAMPQAANVMAATGHGGPNAHTAMAGYESVATESNGSTSDHQNPMPDNGGGSLLHLCLAILTGLILGFALFMARRGVRILRILLPTWPNPVLYGRDRDPPDLLQLCVIRC